MNQKFAIPPAGRSRREFVKAFAQFGAYFGLCAPVCKYFIGEAHAQTANLPGVFTVDLAVSPFTALQQLNGSVRVEVPNGAGISPMIAVNNSIPSIIITRLPSNQFGSVSQRCTHEGIAVNTQAALQNYVQCPLHGSRFNPLTGAVMLGPAAAPLASFTSVFTASPAPGILRITIPVIGGVGIGYTIAGNAISPTNGARIRLQFPTRSGSNYDLRFRSTVNGTNSSIPLLFSTTQNGALNTTNVVGSGAVQSVYLAPSQQVGFYIISAKP